MTLDERLAAARGGGAAGPVESRGILRLAGKGARDFLHRISTQHVAKLPADGSTYAAFLDNHGHVVGEGLVVARPDDLLLLTEADEVPLLLPHLRKYLLAAPVRIDDASAELAAMAVLGPDGVARARAAAAGAPVTVAATPRRGVPAVEVVGPREALQALRDGLVAGGLAPLSADDLEVLRVEEGVARFGAEIGPERLPMEAALTRDAIHFDKGCYIGQETVTRATFRGQIQRGLVQLELPPGAGPGATLSAEGKDVGQVTSAVATTRGRLGLGFVRRAHWREGERLATPAGDAVVRRVLVHEPPR